MMSLGSQLLSIFLFILPIWLSQLLEYRLWKNYGQLIYDYSSNNRHGWNGGVNYEDSFDCLFTDRGAYLNSVCRVSIQDFLFPNPISIYIWAISDDTMASGRLYCRWSSTRQLQVFREKTYSRVNANFKSPVSAQFINGYSNFWSASNQYLDIWVLITLEINLNVLKVYKNYDTILQFSDSSNYYDDRISNTFHLGNDKSTNVGFGGFVWYLAIYNEANVQNRYLSATSSSTCFIGTCSICNPSFKITDLGNGCGPNSVSTVTDSSGTTCLSGFGCRGSNPIKCNCPTKSCEFTTSSTCSCIDTSASTLTKYEAACSFTSVGQGCCKPDCSSCSDEISCITCKDSSSSVVNGQCVCNDGYTPDLTKIVLSCVKCNFKCKACSSQNYCTQCLDNVAQPNNGDCTCPDGYFSIATSSSFKCSSCLSECKTCENSIGCLACKDENSILLNAIPARCICIDGYFGEFSNNVLVRCTKCDRLCSLCTSLNECTKCKENTVMINGICECTDGFYTNFQSSGEINCLACSYPCKTCSSSSKCLTCADDHQILTEEYKCTCIDGYYMNKLKFCESCDDTCKTCSSSDYCPTCQTENTLNINGTCVCKQGFYETSQPSGGLKCLECSNPCKTCLSLYSCLTCKDDHQILTRVNTCACIEGYYMNDLKYCESCNETCKACLSKNKCTRCLNSTYELVNDMKCLSKCQNNLIRIDEDCGCRPGFHILNGFCVDYYFDFKVSLDSKNRILLKFDQSLKKRLEHKNFKIKFSYDLDFQIFTKSSSQLLIIFDFKESIFANSTIYIEISQPIYSEKNAKLKKYKFSMILNEFEYVDPDIKPLIGIFQTITKVIVTVSIGISFISTPAASWAIIGTLQLLPYIPLSEFYNNTSTIQFFVAADDLTLIPNCMVYIFDRNSSTTPYDRAKISGIDTSVFWINIGKIVLPLIFFICLWPFMAIASKFNMGKLTLKLLKLLENYKYSLFLRFWIQAYIDIEASSIIQLKSVKIKQFKTYSDAEFYFNQFSAAASMVISI